jgi:FkbM family methyltransferase
MVTNSRAYEMRETLGPLLHDVIKTDEGNSLTLVFPDEYSLSETKKIFSGECYPVRNVANLLGVRPKIIVDIGANVGAFSITNAIIWPNITIYAFECGRIACDCMRQNIKSFSNIRMFGFGLGLGHHELTLKRSIFGSPGASLGSGGVNLPSDEIAEIRDAGEVMRELNIEIIDILKIDTEGCELPILMSIMEIIKNTKVVFIEYHSEEDRRMIDMFFLSTHKLFLGSMQNPHRGELCYVANALCSPWDHWRIIPPSSMSLPQDTDNQTSSRQVDFRRFSLRQYLTRKLIALLSGASGKVKN